MRGWVFIVGFLLMLAFEYARAETVFLETLPSNAVTSTDALKQIASGKPSWKCTKKKAGPNLNPVKVKGSKVAWFNAESLGTGVENVFEAFSSGKALYACEQMEGNETNGRVRKVAE